MAPRRGPVDTGVDAGRTALKRAEPGRPGRVRVRSLAARTAAVLLAAFAALLALPLQAQAQVNVPDDWALIPAGLEVGDSFRLLFLSSTKRDGSSTNIGDYNNTVRSRAGFGHAAIQEHASQFNAVGCTAAVDARDNTGTTGTGVPIYWLNGNKVADDNADFYDGNWDDEANDKNESGNNGPNTSNSGNYPLTGCDHDGTQDFRALGTSTSIRVGRPNTAGSDNGPLHGGSNTVTTSQTRPMYGLSAVFTVEATTDATLSGLALENADDDSTIALNETFATGTKSYTASVATGVDEITVLPETTDDGATVEYLDGSDATITDSDSNKDDQQVELDVGANTIKVKVTAADDVTTETYTVVVTRASDTTAPSPESAEVVVTGTSVTVIFNEDLDIAVEFLPAAVVNAFTVTADGVDLDINGVAAGALNHQNSLHILLPTGTTISENQTVKLSYDKTVAGADALEDAAGNEVASFLDFAVTNNSTVAPNNPPVFPSSTAARNVAENSPAGTDVGNPVTANDGDNDTLTYTLEGADAVSFDLVTISGSAQIRTKSGVTYDHETKSSYAVTVKADDSNGGSDTIAVSITVTDVNEAPARPAFPSVASVANSTTSLAVTWTAPSNTGPPISNYDLRYRQGTSGGWTNGPQNVTGTSATISSLSANTLYQVQVLATNNEGDSLWSPSGSGRTNMAGNTAPTFPSSTAARSVAENSPAGTDVGNAVTATDDDNDPLTYTIEGGDAASFTIVTTAGSAQIRTRSGVTYDREAQPTYTVIVKADDGNGGTDTVTVTITLTDVDEPPLAPAAPTVTATPNTTDSLSVSWRAPSSTGRPAIDSYDLQYREGTTGNWIDGPQNVSGTSATISGLSADPAAYQVQVRATNDEGDGRWSPPGRISTTSPGPTSRSRRSDDHRRYRGTCWRSLGTGR